MIWGEIFYLLYKENWEEMTLSKEEGDSDLFEYHSGQEIPPKGPKNSFFCMLRRIFSTNDVFRVEYSHGKETVSNF